MKRVILISGGLAACALAAAAWIASADTETPQAADIAALEKSIGEVEHEVQTVRDQDAIENLISAYGYYLDKSQWDQLADLFAEDGSIELSQRGVYVGKKRVREMLDLMGPQGVRTGHLANHMQLQPIVDVAPDGKSAKIRSRALLQLGDYGGKGYWGDGVYENEAVKEGGVWKFKAVHFFGTFGSDYDKGWAKDAMKAVSVSDKLPPDRPPSIVYEQYPKAFVPPFHYKNPVSGK